MEDKDPVASSWKEMFYEALSNMKSLEKEIVHKDGEIESLKRRIKVSETGQELVHTLTSKLITAETCLQQSLDQNIKLEDEKNIEREQQGVLNAAFEGLKAEVEAVLTATESFKAEAVHSMQALTTDVRRYQAASDRKIQSLRHKVEKMEDLQGVKNGVLKTVAEEQEILRLICNTRAAMQQSTAASLQHLTKLEQFCGKTIQQALSTVDSARTKTLHNGQQMPDMKEQLEAMVSKHKRDLSQAEKNLLESITSQTSLRGLPDEDNNVENLEHGVPDCNQVLPKTPVKHSTTRREVEETSTTGRTSAKEIHKQSNLNQSQTKHSKRKSDTLKQLHNFEVLRDVVARRSPQPVPTHQEKAEVLSQGSH